MASPTPDAPAHIDYVPGEMPIAAQASTFHGVMGLIKWCSLGLAALMVLLVTWFCTSAGFIPGAVIAIVMVILGSLFLRAKPKAAH